MQEIKEARFKANLIPLNYFSACESTRRRYAIYLDGVRCRGGLGRLAPPILYSLFVVGAYGISQK